MLPCFPIVRSGSHQKISKFFFYMTLFDTYIMHKTIHNRNRETYVDYRINVAEAILQNVQLSDKMHAKSALIGILIFDSKHNIGPIFQKISIKHLVWRKIQQKRIKFVINTKYEAKRSGNARNVKLYIYQNVFGSIIPCRIINF